MKHHEISLDNEPKPSPGPALTVLMSVRNVPVAMLELSVASMLEQSFRDFEFLIFDDGSRDPATIAALARHARSDPRIHVRHGPARGLTKTLNVGLTTARGRYIARQDADDWSEPDRLQRQAAFLDLHPQVAVCGANAWMHRENGVPLWPTQLAEQAIEIREALWRGNPFVHGATMFRTRQAQAIGGYREQFACSQDYDFFWRLCDTAVGGGCNLAEPLYHYRFRRGSVSEERAAEQARVHRATRILARARYQRKQLDVAQALAEADDRRDSVRFHFSARLKQADHRMLAGDTWGAARSYCSALGHCPVNLPAWGKLIRWCVFMTAPAARRLCFR